MRSLQIAAKKRRSRKCCMGWLCVILLLAIVGAAVALWFIFQPKPPTYTFEVRLPSHTPFSLALTPGSVLYCNS